MLKSKLITTITAGLLFTNIAYAESEYAIKNVNNPTQFNEFNFSSYLSNVPQNDSLYENTDPYAQFNHAQSSRERKQYDRAFYWLVKSANQGHAEAQYHVSYFYLWALGSLGKNFKQAYLWLKLSEMNGFKKAETVLKTGFLTETDPIKIKQMKEADEELVQILKENTNLIK